MPLVSLPVRAFAACLLLAVTSACAGPTVTPNAPMGASAEPVQSPDSAGEAAAILATGSYRFDIDFTTPQRTMGGFQKPAASAEGGGSADAHAGTLRVAYEEVDSRFASGAEILMIGEEAWSRMTSGGRAVIGWVRTVPGATAFSGLEPWALPGAVASAEGVAQTAPGEYTGTLDLRTSTLADLDGSVGADVSAVPFTLTLDAEGRPATFHFATVDGTLSAAYSFTDYGLTVDEKPPSDAELGDPLDAAPGTDTKCSMNGEPVDCDDIFPG
ncbi:hypothetical protein AB0I28_04820 [Phytomonospora sp. NPDC050363]|uniref:hypothetical protein n=1 Tax=Phytomonospora sp. NPDC050363 TaxID=3155642 RepID=UPI003404E16A